MQNKKRDMMAPNVKLRINDGSDVELRTNDDSELQNWEYESECKTKKET